MSKYHSQNPFGVFEIRLALEKDDVFPPLCEQERFSNHIDACRYVYMMNNHEGRYKYPGMNFKYFVIYNPPSQDFIDYIRNSCFAPNRQIKREKNSKLF